MCNKNTDVLKGVNAHSGDTGCLFAVKRENETGKTTDRSCPETVQWKKFMIIDQQDRRRRADGTEKI